MKKWDEERGVTALLERVHSDIRIIAEGLAGLNTKVDAGFVQLRQEMAIGFSDVQTALAELSKRLGRA